MLRKRNQPRFIPFPQKTRKLSFTRLQLIGVPQNRIPGRGNLFRSQTIVTYSSKQSLSLQEGALQSGSGRVDFELPFHKSIAHLHSPQNLPPHRLMSPGGQTHPQLPRNRKIPQKLKPGIDPRKNQPNRSKTKGEREGCCDR